MTTLCLLSFSAPCRAGGCHTQDRPVISDTLSWETDQNIAKAGTPVARAPAVLTRPRCGDEIPLGTDMTALPTVAALFEHPSFPPFDSREPLVVDPGHAHSQPPAVRLDRPPRTSAAL
jgi:hypothetical protein